MASYFFNAKKEEPKKTPVGGFGERFQNMAKNNYRGLLGTLVPMAVLIPQLSRYDVKIKLKLMWMMMMWFYLVQPIAVPVTSLIPVFLLPMGGILDNGTTCKSYMNETIMLFVLSGWLIVLLNNSGLDKRIAFYFLSSGNASQYTGKQMVYKCSCAAFVLSIFSSRLIATFTITEVMTNAYEKLAGGNKDAKSPDFIAMREVVNNAIQTSAGIGGTAIIHSSTVNILFRGCYQELAPHTYEFPDVFNYLQYSAFAFPVAIVMFFLNLAYHMQLVDSVSKGQSAGMSVAQTTELQKIIGKESATIPAKMSLHETYSVLFAFLFLMAVFFRWNTWFNGWAGYSADKKESTIPGLKDATVGAIFCILLHILPKSFDFMKIWGAKKKSDLPPLKPESSILWWRFVDKNINYGYIFTFGSAFALLHAATATELDHEIGLGVGKKITNLDWKVGILIVVVVAAILCNLCTAMAACSMWLPFVLLMSGDGASPWPTNAYIAALGVGIASNFGFCVPFPYTPAYYSHNTGKTPIMKMVKHSIPTVIMCSIILYIALIFYAPNLWSSEGFAAVLPATNTLKPKTTASTTAAAGGQRMLI